MPDNDRGIYAQVVGGVTYDPEIKPTSAGDALKFQLAVKTGWGKDDFRFIRVTTWNDGLISRRSEIYKGAQGVFAEGWLKNKPYNGKDSWELVADSLGLVERFPASRKGQTVPVSNQPVADVAYADV